MTYTSTIDGRQVQSERRYIIYSKLIGVLQRYTSLGLAVSRCNRMHLLSLNVGRVSEATVYVWCDEHRRFEEYDADDAQFSRKRC